MSTSLEPKSSPSDFYSSLKGRAGEIEARYRSLTLASARLTEDAKQVQPGGTTRDAVLRQPYPNPAAHCFLPVGPENSAREPRGAILKVSRTRKR